MKYAQDADIVDRRLANFMIEKYNLTSVPALPSSRRLTFQWVLLLMIGPDFKNERDTWRRWIKYFDPHEYLLLRLAVLTCFQIIPVEFTIRVNNVQGVNDVFQPGQILALVASLGGMLSLGMALCIQKSTSGSNAGKKLYIYMPLDEDAEATEVCRMRDIEQGVTAKKEAAGQEGSTQTGGGVVVTTILEEDRK